MAKTAAGRSNTGPNRGILVFVGPPGSGKGTVAQWISDKFGLDYFSPGNYLKELDEQNLLPKDVKRHLESGGLLSDRHMDWILRHYVSAHKGDFWPKKGHCGLLILDGYPRTKAQLHYILANGIRASPGRSLHVAAIIHVYATDAELHRRLTGRLMCEKCFRTFQKSQFKAHPPSKCPSCKKGKLVTRPDDSPQVVASRLSTYRKNTFPIIPLARKACLKHGLPMIELDTTGQTPQQDRNAVAKRLKEYGFLMCRCLS